MRRIARSLLAAGLLLGMLAAANPTLAGSPLSGKVIVVDPGHGGRDPGALANGLREKDLTLAMAMDLRQLLQSQGAQVVMTRTSDTDLGPTTDTDLQARVSAAQAAHANAFVSVHANFSSDPGYSGATTYFGPKCGYYSGATLSPTDVGRSYSLAQRVESAVVSRTGEISRGTPSQIFWVLGDAGIPSILVETGFISNQGEAGKLANPAYQQTIASAIADGLASFFASGDATGSPSAPASALADCGSGPAPATERWVQTFLPAPLLSGPSANAQLFSTLPPFSYLKVLDQKGDYFLVLNPVTNGPGYVEAKKVGPSGPPPPPPAFTPFWVENFNPVTLWSGPDAKAVSFGALPPWHFFHVAAQSNGPRFLVQIDTSGNVAYVDRANVGPSGPPPSSIQAAPVMQTALAARQPVPVARSRSVTVQPGDTLSAIAARYHTTVAALMALNSLASADLIVIGRTLRLPG